MGGTGTGTGDITFMGAILPGDGRQPVYCFQLRAVEHTQKNWITAQKKITGPDEKRPQVRESRGRPGEDLTEGEHRPPGREIWRKFGSWRGAQPATAVPEAAGSR